MTTRQTLERAVNLNSVAFPITGPVEVFIASANPEKYVIGDFAPDTHPFLSPITWDDPRWGIGRDTFDRAEPTRIWWSTCSLSHRSHLVLQRRTVTTAAASTVGTVGFLNEINSQLMASFGTSVHAYDNTLDSWGSSLRTLLNAVTDSISAMVNGTRTLALATGSEVDWSTDGTAWNRNSSAGIKYLAYWNDLLWGITAAGVLYHTTNLTANWAVDATLQLPSGYVTKLFTGPSPDRREKRTLLYAATQVGLYVYDYDAVQWLETDLPLPYHPNNGKGAGTWGRTGAIYFSAGNAIYEYIPGVGRRVMGPDLADGLPTDRRGTITTLIGTHNDLIVGLDSSIGSVTTLNSFASAGVYTHHVATIATDSGYPTLLGWGGGPPPAGQRGWEVKWPDGNQGAAIDSLFVGNTYSAYRLWWGSGGRVFYQSLPTDIVNPTQVTTTQYASSGVWESPWFDAGNNAQTKLAVLCWLETRNPTSSETAVLAYATNDTESYTPLGTQSAAGNTRYLFPNSSSPTGTAFRTIRFRLSLARGSTNTNTPDVRKLTLSYARLNEVLLGFTFTVNLTAGDYKGSSIKALRSSLLTAMTSTSAMQFTYRDDSDTARNYWVLPAPSMIRELARGQGYDESGQSRVTFLQLTQTG